MPTVQWVHPTHGISLPAQQSCILLEPGQSHGLDQPTREKSSAESHTWWVWGFLTSNFVFGWKKSALLTSLYQNHTFLEGKVQKRHSTLVSWLRELRKICWGELAALQMWEEMGQRKREGALNVFLQGYYDIIVIFFKITQNWTRGTTETFWKPFWSSPILSLLLWPSSILTVLVLIRFGIDAV